jgi:hypothetical protein
MSFRRNLDQRRCTVQKNRNGNDITTFCNGPLSDEVIMDALDPESIHLLVDEKPDICK